MTPPPPPPPSAPPSYPSEPLRIAFIHPNLGIGGAERLIIDAALSLQERGHHVEVFTSFHEDGDGGRSFEETRDGTLQVHVLGNSIFPQHLFSRFYIIFAIFRQLHLTLSFLLATLLYHIPLPFFVLPLSTPFTSSSDWSPRRQLPPFDILVIDQLSTCIPLFRWWGSNRVLFYCHFPDLLLSPSHSASSTLNDPRRSNSGSKSLGSALRSIYRKPIDGLEEMTTGEADKILVNSGFTSEVFVRTFQGLRRVPRVVHPSVDYKAFGNGEVELKGEEEWLMSDRPTLLSINRFEKKKDVALAINAFAEVRADHPDLRLVLAGGYDPTLSDNITTLRSLQQLCTRLSLSFHTYLPPSLSTPSLLSSNPHLTTSPPSPSSPQPSIIFLINAPSHLKSHFLSSPSTLALLYTPSYEHFGIVPLEAMASRLPVLATNSGGPRETVEDGSTGLLRSPVVGEWSAALRTLLALSPSERAEWGRRGRERVEEKFSYERLGRELEEAVKEVVWGSEKAVWEEVGFSKMLAFLGIACVVGGSGVVAFWYGGK